MDEISNKIESIEHELIEEILNPKAEVKVSEAVLEKIAAEAKTPYSNTFEELFLEPDGTLREMTITPMSFLPLNGVDFKLVQTAHEGKVAYAPAWNYWVRLDTPGSREGDVRRGTNFFAELPQTQTSDTSDLMRLVLPNGSLNMVDKEREAYITTLVLWSWFKDNSRSNLQDYSNYIRQNPISGWPSPRFYLDMWNNLGEILLGACNSKAQAFGVFLACCGMDPWRQMIATARYVDGVNSVPTHVYNALYIAGRWRYLDVTFVHSGLFPAYLPRDERPGWLQMNIGHFPTVDYAHPLSGEQPENIAIFGMPSFYAPGVPILGAEPFDPMEHRP
ncbi:hypothetical protein E1180_14420 [Roseibium denhamense]|uniref:Transglutaminase-like domain-containing protein n=1 Tax=Roseibium denhamense TaxID=76305 RepID=A0ABY1NI59_9HYPH|nr:hypothetical protein [Roseibium denhamense]MTI06708.1 hypothetical protein [Roseibium denhamense]SMP10442.1 hypothetical protein SAMN06265374_1231 [Roseibium denhamense]